MYLIDPVSASRRAFLQRMCRLAVAGAATPLGMNLAAIGEAAAFNATDYKALVCVFLYGGNDHANTVVNYDQANWTAYSNIRQLGAAGLAIDRPLLAATRLTPAVPLGGGLEYALNPAMPALTDRFNAGQAAVLLNVGPLVRPTTRAEFFSPDRARYPLPPQLMSHNDQQSVWQAQGAEGSAVGWGGNLGDLAQSSNGNSLFTCISATGNAVFLTGDNAIQYQISRVGAVQISPAASAPHGLRSAPYSSQAAALVRALLTESRSHVLENEYNRVTRRAIEAEAQMSAALGGVTLNTAFPSGNTLADELRIVARTIAARGTLGNRRQVFLVSLGGFDTHDRLMQDQPLLLKKVDDALAAFYQATVELGVSNQVTAFTASDFGRALASNGNGTDHGWGGHHFIMGGAVRGQSFYGTPPPVSIGNSAAPEDQWHIGQGRLIPSTSVDQYAATLAKWFGVSSTEMNAILPNLLNFGAAAGYPTDLGFLA
ncbi:DUF1501 domain-containing protein [Leptothrix discophora]|uniref:DUF1501 domain-containing protein n=1 Tax=Leptothrix discophora TaxID=89 RepID=A0ABT9G890_LEPDI|nr:DUF1501 domain-containing protein [Leptothrix discophora]MDP4302686.1 DUF1501 domain-containing protein [Leptothrix discophora]